MVRVARLLRDERDYDGTESVKRPPRVGDTGTVVTVLGTNEKYVVECVAPSGRTVWLAEFTPEELSPVKTPE